MKSDAFPLVGVFTSYIDRRSFRRFLKRQSATPTTHTATTTMAAIIMLTSATSVPLSVERASTGVTGSVACVVRASGSGVSTNERRIKCQNA